MKNIFILLIAVFFVNCKQKTLNETSLEILKYKNDYQIKINYFNNSSDTIGIVFRGVVKDKSSDNNEIYKLLFDTQIDIMQDGFHVLSDTLYLRKGIRLDPMYKYFIVYPFSMIELPVHYYGNLIKDFKIKNDKFEIKIICKQPTKYIDKLLFGEENKNI